MDFRQRFGRWITYSTLNTLKITNIVQTTVKEQTNNRFLHRSVIDIEHGNGLKESEKFVLKVDDLVCAKYMVTANSWTENLLEIRWDQESKHDSIEILEHNFLVKLCNSSVVQSETRMVCSEWIIKVNLPSLDPTNDDNSLHTTSDGNIKIKLIFTLKFASNPFLSPDYTTFKKMSKDGLGCNLGTLLEGKILHSDVKIFTKDKAQLQAHKCILHARSPYFASMFGSNFLENSTGVVNADEISAKTMKILLNYWYTGELLPSWMDDDTILEFVYAAGKYQMAQVLEMLNGVLGNDFNFSDVDVDLLKITHQLSLKNAEARMLKRIVWKISKVECGTEILKMFSIVTEKYDENSSTASQILKACSDAMAGNDDKLASHHDIKLMAFAIDFGMKNVEQKLLKCVIHTVGKIACTEQLLDLFDIKTAENGCIFFSDS